MFKTHVFMVAMALIALAGITIAAEVGTRESYHEYGILIAVEKSGSSFLSAEHL